jgi:hypothetical protein
MLQTKAGTQLIISKNAFIHQDGSLVTGSIQIEIKEIFYKSEMIFNGITTLASDNLLESFGMVNIKAISNLMELVLKEDKKILLSIPNNQKGYDGQLFYGEEIENKTINWVSAESNSDTTVSIETIIPLSFGRDSISLSKYKLNNGEFEYVSGTQIDKVQLESMDIVLINPPNYYSFTISKLGWINCDRFLKFNDLIDLKITVDNFESPQGYVIFKKLNSILPIHFDENEVGYLTSLPKGDTVQILLIDKSKENLRWTIENHVLGTKDKIRLTPSPIDKDRLAAELRKLDL